MEFNFDFNDYVSRLARAADELMLREILFEGTDALGFDQFAMNHHVDLTNLPEDAISMMSYDPNWVELAISKRYHLDDPIHAASVKTAVGFLWSEVPRMVKLSRRQRDILDAARQFGLREGYTVPFHVPGEYRGTCSFGARSLDRVPHHGLEAAQLLGAFAFEAARRIMRSRRAADALAAPLPKLSQRQLDCVTLVARGKGDWEIARILDLSEATVHQHIETARKRYNVGKRTQLVVRALFDGQISFSDAIQH